MDRIKARLEIGLDRYGHGVRVNDNTQSWGTKHDSWMEMADEELLDCMIYVVADYIRLTRGVDDSFAFETTFFYNKDEVDDNKSILYILEHWEYIDSQKHKNIIGALFNII